MIERWAAIDPFSLWHQRRGGQPQQIGPSKKPTYYMAARYLHSVALENGFTQLWVHPDIAVDDRPGDAEMWNVPERDRGKWWRHAYRTAEQLGAPEGSAAHELVIPSLNLSTEGGSWDGCWSAAKDARELCAALGEFRDEFGTLPHRGPSSTGNRLLLQEQRLSSHDAAREKLGRAWPPDVAGRCEPELTWKRPLDAYERSLPYVHSYDKHGQFLAACSSVSVGLGLPARAINPLPAYQALPGYWLITPDESAAALWTSARLPYPYPSKRAQQWVTTPTLAFIRAEVDPLVEVTEGWYWLQHARYLEPWYKRLRDARGNLATGSIAREAIKPIYTQTIGLLGHRSTEEWDRTDDPLYRPDWREMIIGTARCNTLRNLLKLLPVAPFAVGADCLYFASDNPNALEWATDMLPSLNLGEGIGKYAVKDEALPMSEFLPLYESKHLAAIQTWAKGRQPAPA